MAPRRLPSVLAALVALALALAVTACGGDDGGGTTVGSTTIPQPTTTEPVASTPDATTPPPDATQPIPPPATDEGPPPPQPETTPTEPGRGGDEQPIRVPATFTIRDGALDPPTITVPPFLAVEISVTAPDGGNHEVVIGAPQPQTLTVSGGRRAAVKLAGLRAGRYPIEVDGRAAGTLVAGGEVGP